MQKYTNVVVKVCAIFYKKSIDIVMQVCYNIDTVKRTNHKLKGVLKMTNREEAKRIYKETKAAWLANQTNENWIAFCNAKRTCRLLGIRI